MTRNQIFGLFWILACLPLASPLLPAQIPAGWAVTSSFRNPQAPGVGGLWAVHPRNPGLALPITGVPAFVSGCQWPSILDSGSDFVLRLDDGRLVTNGWPYPLPPTPTPMTVGILTLSGLAVTSVQTYDFGTINSTSTVGLPQAALLPDGRILFAVDRVGTFGQPLYNQTLAVLDPNLPPSPTNPAPIPLNGWTPASTTAVNGLCIDPTGLTAYFATVNTATVSGSGLWQAQLGTAAPGLSPVLIASIPNSSVRCLGFDRTSGTVIGGGLGLMRLFRCNPVTAALTNIPFAERPNAIVIEPATDALLIVSSAPSPEAVFRWPAGSATPTLLSSGPSLATSLCAGFAPGWGLVSGIDIAPTHRRLGPGVPGAVSNYDWNLSPSGNALPFSGNPSFALSLESTTGSTSGWLGIATAALSTPLVLGGNIPIYIDPAAMSLLDLPSAPVLPLGPFAIPLGLSGISVYFQSLHFDGAASSGLAVTIL